MRRAWHGNRASPARKGKINLVGGRKGMEQSMTAVEAARLIDWLKANGHSAEDAADCIKYIATGIQRTQKTQKTQQNP